MSALSDRYWNSPEGKAKRQELSAVSREHRNRLPYPRSVSPSYNKVAEYDQRKRAEFIVICAAYSYCCVSCGSHGPLTRDHVRPTVRLGTSAPDNIQPLCSRCNELKHTRIIDYRLNPHPHCLAP